VAGQQAENLLDLDDAPTEEGPSGLAATQILPSTPSAANFLLETSANPLDDLVSIFGGMSASGGGSGDGGADGVLGGLGGMGSFGAISPTSGNGTSPLDRLGSPTTIQKPQEDLLGLF
jgi:AP-1 complex subunit beta-1